ncbi:hypothetical protein AJ80_03053 [Polytolypa hystricis UAMH7299]|uniref:Velvet domain-containing protein n=1 Tax=Polytolypa hystricis (strain UAMH7299) TaxID=1447883 RepID=A0A2B7YKA3_POLH7|nr:hypothetical protein AJ80_03053 [Polytolypa hystricis UAMH7299]
MDPREDRTPSSTAAPDNSSYLFPPSSSPSRQSRCLSPFTPRTLVSGARRPDRAQSEDTVGTLQPHAWSRQEVHGTRIGLTRTPEISGNLSQRTSGLIPGQHVVSSTSTPGFANIRSIHSRSDETARFSQPTETYPTALQGRVVSPSRQSNTSASVPSGFAHLIHPQQGLAPPEPAQNSRLRLFVRQQPIAARACVAGDKGRRCIDPTPILQLLITDFSPSSQGDLDVLIHNTYVVGCHLFSISRTYSDGKEDRVECSIILDACLRGGKRSSRSSLQAGDVSQVPQKREVKILAGYHFVSPFYVDADPEPASAPPHPQSAPRSQQQQQQRDKTRTSANPSTFFIFPDICVRTAGLYRLQFTLIETTVGAPSILHETWSEPFRVYVAKDFPGMRPTPYLARQLKLLGAGGIKIRGESRRRGGGRTGRGGQEDADEDEDG